MSDNYITVGTNFEVQSGFAFPSTSFVENGIPIVRMSDLKTGRVIFKNAKYVSEKWLKTASPFTLKCSDFLMGMSGSLTNYAVISDDDVPSLLNQRVGRLKSKNNTANYNYVCYWLKSEGYACFTEIQGEGAAQKNISAKQIGQFLYRDAHILEQNKIAEILQAIDQTIEKTKALVEKYQQIKAGLMHDLFTRGITADGKLRPPREQAPELYQETPIGWIPKDWDDMRLGDTCDWYSGGTPSRRNSTWWEGSIPWLSPKDMKSFDLSDTEEHVTKSAALVGSRVMPINTIFIVVRGMILAHSFPVVFSNSEFCFNQDIKAISGLDDVDNRFLAYWFVAKKDVFLKKTTEATHGTKRFDMKDLYDLRIGVPRPEEQSLFVDRLNILDNQLDMNKDYVKKLNKQKFGLMHDLLTGKVPVTIDEPDAINA